MRNITKIQLEDVTIDNTIGSLAALSESLWFGTALKAHVQGQCMDLHKVYILVIGHQILASDRTVFLMFANTFDLLNLFRSVASGYDTQLCGDVTSKASQAALNKLGFGVNMLGSSFAPLSFTLMPAECESQRLIVKPIAPPRQRCVVSFHCLDAPRRIAPRASASADYVNTRPSRAA